MSVKIVDISKEEFVLLRGRMTNKQIASYLKTTLKTVDNSVRFWGLSKFTNAKDTKEEFIKLRKRGFTNKQLAEYFDIDVETVSGRVTLWGLPKTKIKRVIDKEMLSSLREEGMTIKELQDYFNCSRYIIQESLKKYGLGKKKYKNNLCSESIQRMLNQGKTRAEIAKVFSCSVSKIDRFVSQKGLKRPKIDEKTKFLSDIEESESGCWEWRKTKNADGYGTTYLNGSSWFSHRLSYTLFVEEIPKGLYILHKCHNRACCNPDHLYAGTQIENMKDAIERGSFYFVAEHRSSLVNQELIKYVKRLKKEGWSAKSISGYINISETTVYRWLKR